MRRGVCNFKISVYHTHFYLHVRRHTYKHFVNKRLRHIFKRMHTNVLSLSFYMFNSTQIHVHTLLCVHLHKNTCLCACYVCMSVCVHARLCFRVCVGVSTLVGVCALVNAWMRQSSWRAEGSQSVSSCLQNTKLQVAAQPSDVFTRCNFALVAEKLRTSLQCSSPASPQPRL